MKDIHSSIWLVSPTLLNFGIFNYATYMRYATLIVLSHAVECL
jgi:hypothetical protein